MFLDFLIKIDYIFASYKYNILRITVLLFITVVCVFSFQSTYIYMKQVKRLFSPFPVVMNKNLNSIARAF